MNEFNGANIRRALEARGISAVALAELIGVTKSAISHYEHGTKIPHPDTQTKIGRALNLPVSFFYQPTLSEEIPKIYFRSLAAATKTARTKEVRRFQWHVMVTEFVRRFAELPYVEIPDLDISVNPGHITFDEIELYALEIRRAWGLGVEPISDVVELLESKGIVLARCRFDNDSLDAYSSWANDGPHIILGDDKDAAVRSRFDAVHELAHLVLHKSLDTKVLNDRTTLRLVETQAHCFAGAFLLPDTSFSSDFFIPTLDSLLSLKLRWKVSVAAMIMRSLALGLISEEQQKRLMIGRARRGWLKREPYDDDIPVERPALLKTALELGLMHGRTSRSAIRAMLPFAPTDIEQLAGLPYGFLSDVGHSGVRLKQSESPDDGSDNIIRFPSN